MKKRMFCEKMILVLLIAVLLIPLSLVAEAKETVGAGSEDLKEIKKDVVIGFKNQSPGLAVAEVKSVGGSVSKSYKHMSIVAAKLSEEEISELVKSGKVAYIEEDVEIAALSEDIPWGVQTTSAPALWPFASGKGIKVAILDTGVDINHTDLTFEGGVNTVDGSSYSGVANHGSHVSGIVGALANSKGVVGMAPSVELYSVKVLADDGKGTLSALIAGLDWAIDNDMDIVNMSLGTTTDTSALRDAVDRAYNAGILLIAAAGNSGTAEGNTDTIRYPAKYESVIAVGAVDKNNTRASFSATGPNLELTAPGVSIYSTIPGDRYALASGTSMAAPHVAGAAALIWAKNPEFTNLQVRNALRNGAIQEGSAYQYGYGIINLNRWIPEPEPEPEPEPSTPLETLDLRITLTIGSKITIVNEAKKYLDVEPYVDATAYRTMVPVRFISEHMGAEVTWNQENKIVTIASEEHTITITIGSKVVVVDGKTMILDVSPTITDSRTFVPIRFISETLGADVFWEGTAKKVTIEK